MAWSPASPRPRSPAAEGPFGGVNSPSGGPDDRGGRTWAATTTTCHQAGEFGYADDGAVTGTFTATEPFPVGIDLDALR